MMHPRLVRSCIIGHRASEQQEFMMGFLQGKRALIAGLTSNRSIAWGVPEHLAVDIIYLGSMRSVPHYNLMGLAKAGLEANVSYMASTSVQSRYG